MAVVTWFLHRKTPSEGLFLLQRVIFYACAADCFEDIFARLSIIMILYIIKEPIAFATGQTIATGRLDDDITCRHGEGVFAIALIGHCYFITIISVCCVGSNPAAITAGIGTGVLGILADTWAIYYLYNPNTICLRWIIRI